MKKVEIHELGDGYHVKMLMPVNIWYELMYQIFSNSTVGTSEGVGWCTKLSHGSFCVEATRYGFESYCDIPI